MPNADPLLIGGDNFYSLNNMVPDPNGLCGSPGYSKVVANILSTYLCARSGIQLRTKDTMLSGVFVQALNAAGTASAIMQQYADASSEDVPNIKDFESTPVHTDAAGAGLGRFSKWPGNQIAYCNGVDSLIYGGPELPPAKLFICEGSMADTLTDPVDYTDAVNNTLRTPGNTVRFSGSYDPALALYIKGNGTDGSTSITDESSYGHAITAAGNAAIDTAYKKFGTGAIIFDGTGDWLTVPWHTIFKFGTNAFALAAQAKISPAASVGTNRGWMSQYVDANNYWCFGYEVSSTSRSTIKPFFKVVSGGTTIADYIATSWYSFGTSAFKHIELDRSGSNIYIFIEGSAIPLTANTPIGTAAMPDFSASSPDLIICGGAGIVNTFHGWLDEIMVFNGLARHVAGFSAPTTEESSGNFATIVTDRPIQAIKAYLNSVNITAGASISVKVWDGSNMSALTITDGSSGLTVDEGIISFGSTVDFAKPKIINGTLGYVYQFALSAGTAEIYRITIDAPWQPVMDIWDGVLRPVIEACKYEDSRWQDQTALLQDETPVGVSDMTYYVMGLGGFTTAEKIELAFSAQTIGLKIKMSGRESTACVNTNAANMIVYRWNGGAWIEVAGLIDGTSDSGVTLDHDGYVTWNAAQPGEEQQKALNDVTLWRYRIMFSAALSSPVHIDKIVGVPAPQLTNRGYKFPMMLQNRAMLCGLLSTGEGNRIDFALANSSEGFNGEDSSFGESGPLYIGDQNELTAGCEIFNRLGQSIYAFGLFFKATQTHILHGYDNETYQVYQINDKIGTPAPLTLDTYTITDHDQNSRSIAAFLSFEGPYMFDSAGLTYLSGIECYFDRTDARCINFDAIETARGWFDADYPRYNLQIPSGTGQTTNNVWLVYDFQKNKWYPKTPSCTSPFFGAVVRVADVYGKSYVYGFRENGYAMRLDYGTTWDGTAISQHIETGEILASNKMWDVLQNKLLKLLFIPTAEANVNLAVKMYIDGSATAVDVATISLTKGASDPRFVKKIKNFPKQDFWSYRMRFETSTAASAKGMQLLGWAIQFANERPDVQPN